MSKIVKNSTESDVAISDVGITVPASGQFTIAPQEYLIWAASNDIILLIGNGTLVINDGSSDLSISDGVDLIKGIFPSLDGVKVEIKPKEGEVDTKVSMRRSDLHELKEEFSQLKEVMLSLSSNITVLTDGTGQGFEAKVNKFNSLKVIDQRIPTDDDVTTLIPIKREFKDSNGNLDLRVDGSTSYVDYVIEAEEGGDLFIDSISFRIADVNATADKFGNISPLTNGCQLFYSDLNNGEIIIGDSLKTNFDFIRLCQGQPSFGNANDALRIANASGNSEGYIPVLDFSQMFGLPWGVRLRKNTKEKIVIRINDNTSGVDAFDAVAFGIKKLV